MIDALNNSREIVIDKLSTWLEYLINLLPNIALAIVILVVFYFIARFAKLMSQKLLGRFSIDTEINYLTSSVVYLVVLLAGVLISLNILHLEKTVTSLLAGAGVIGLALGFAFQDLSANFISGVFIIFRKPFKEGDIISTFDFLGKVSKIDFRVTTIETFQGLHVMIPNKEIQNNPVTNYTKTNTRRVDVSVGVSYGDDLRKVESVLSNNLNNLSFRCKDKDAQVFFKEFGGSSVNLEAFVWIEYPDEPGFLKAQSEIIITIKETLDENGFTIPFPIRTLDFGIKGGEKFSAMMETKN